MLGVGKEQYPTWLAQDKGVDAGGRSAVWKPNRQPRVEPVIELVQGADLPLSSGHSWQEVSSFLAFSYSRTNSLALATCSGVIFS